MSTFSTFVKEQPVTLNHEGEEAFSLSAEMELYTAVVTSFMNDTFYERTDQRVTRIADLVRKCNPRFVAQLAVYARCEMNLRSVPLLLVVELASCHSGDDLVSRTIEKVVLRADDIMELLSCYQWRNCQGAENKKRKTLSRLSHQIQVGLQKAFNRFDEYQFAKYNRRGLAVTLRDALFIVHPKAKDDAQQQLFDKIASDTLATPYTWETELSALGRQHFETAEDRQEAFAAKWEELIGSGKLGYMAMLRNLRNMLVNHVSGEFIRDVALRLGDEQEVLRSRQFPFRFFSAYREIYSIFNSDKMWIFPALEQALQASSQRIAGFDEHTRVLLACDMSGSMQTPVSCKSDVKIFEIGLLLAMLLKNRCQNVVSGIFATNWKVVNLPSTRILQNMDLMYRRVGEVGYATEGHKVLEYLNEQNIVMDKVMMFTDCQMWNSYGRINQTFCEEWDKYKKIAPNAKLYIFDLSGYGATPLDVVREDVTLIAGWGDSIFDMLDAIDHSSAVLEEIKKTEI